MGKILHAFRLIDHTILDSDTEFSGHIDTGFCGCHAVFHHDIFAVTAAIGLFMDLQAYAVSKTVTEILEIGRASCRERV